MDRENLYYIHTDANMAGDVDSRKSTSGYLVTFARGAISWWSKLQKCVALSSTEAEYIAVPEGCKEILWLKRFLQELGLGMIIMWSIMTIRALST